MHTFFEILITENGKTQRHDLHALRIDKKLVKDIPRDQLYPQLKKLGVPNINAAEGWQDLALKYSKFLKAQEEAA